MDTEASSDAVQKQTEAAQAVEAARQTQIDTSNKESEGRIVESFKEAIREAFSLEDGSQKRFIDITRIPRLCDSVISMDTRLESIERNMKWQMRIVGWATPITLGLFGWMLLEIFKDSTAISALQASIRILVIR